MRDEHVNSSKWNTGLPSFTEWLKTLTPMKLLNYIGAIIGAVMLVLLALICCVLTLIQLFVKRMVNVVGSQFVVVTNHNY